MATVNNKNKKSPTSDYFPKWNLDDGKLSQTSMDQVSNFRGFVNFSSSSLFWSVSGVILFQNKMATFIDCIFVRFEELVELHSSLPLLWLSATFECLDAYWPWVFTGYSTSAPWFTSMRNITTPTSGFRGGPGQAKTRKAANFLSDGSVSNARHLKGLRNDGQEQ